ncbi:MAG: transporter substrate-binding domain-containing protein, partial [Burkholderiaceae bacterium]|nr:transporter substrate-binding domain-containing protein [Burkholderiaceae bacterium]
HFAFSDPYYRSQIIFVSADANSPKITPQTVGKRTIGALVNSGQALLVRQHYLAQGATLREYPSSTTLYNAVQNGEVDVVCVSGFAGYEYLKQSENKNLHIVGLHRNLKPEMAGRRVVIHQDNADRIEAINRALLNIKSDGRYQAINLRYFEFMIY